MKDRTCKQTMARFLVIFFGATLLQIGLAGSCLAQDITLSWDGNMETDVASYNIYFKDVETQWAWEQAGSVQHTSTGVVSYQILGLDITQQHCFRVTAINEAGFESLPSDEKCTRVVSTSINTDGDIQLQSTFNTYSTIQTAYDSVPSGQADTLKVKEGDQIPGDFWFDRDVTVRLEGGYDPLFKNIVSVTSFFGTLTITGGPVIVSDLIVK